MALSFRNPFFNTSKNISEVNKGISIGKPTSSNISEQLRGQVEKKENRLSKEIGETHPFDQKLTEDLYKTFGFVTGVVDKYVDFIWSGGFFVKSDSTPAGEKAVTIINQFFSDINFDHYGRQWTKEAIVKCGGYLELANNKNGSIDEMKVLDSKWMFIKRNDKGKITKFNQLKLNGRHKNLSVLGKDDFTSFEPRDIALLQFNKIGDCAYGLGIISPSLITVDNYLGSRKSMHTILSRKANSPLHFRIGNPEAPPSQAEVDDVAQDLQTLTDKTEFATGVNVVGTVIDFPAIGDKFASVLRSDEDNLFFTYQVPEVIMGRGSIPEGLAKAQLEAFERNIKSKQAEIEKVIEEQIIKPVLLANGIDVHVEFEWGQPSNDDNMKRIATINSLLTSMSLSPTARDLLELEVIKLLGLDTSKLEDAKKERENEEDNLEQPLVPGELRDQEKLEPSKVLEIVRKLKQHAHIHEEKPDGKDYSLKEWLGFNFLEYLTWILQATDAEQFEELLGTNDLEFSDGKLTPEQVEELRGVMREGFVESKTITEIADEIDARVKPQDLYISKDGQRRLAVSSTFRANMIARSESTKLAANGALRHYQENGVEEVRFLSANSLRTCPICQGLDGQVYNIGESAGIIPVHTACRCTWTPVVTI